MCPCEPWRGHVCDYHRREREREEACMRGDHSLECYRMERLTDYHQREEA